MPSWAHAAHASHVHAAQCGRRLNHHNPCASPQRTVLFHSPDTAVLAKKIVVASGNKIELGSVNWK